MIRLMFLIMSIFTLHCGLSFMFFGGYVNRNGLRLDFGEYNIAVGVAIVLLGLIFLFGGAVRKPESDRDSHQQQ
jgi:hypothetical protein